MLLRLLNRYLGRTLGGTRQATFGSFKNANLSGMNLGIGPKLVPNGDHEARARALENKTGGWKNGVPSQDIYNRLNDLERQFPDYGMVEAMLRFRISSILLHAATRLPEGVEFVGYAESLSQPVEVFSEAGDDEGDGLPGYIITHMSRSEYIENYKALKQGQGPEIATPNGVFIAKARQGPLTEHIPQLVGEMYGSAMQCKANAIRGVLSNGREWMFTILLLNADRKGGVFSVSDEIAIKFSDSIPPRVAGNGPDIVANILAHWIHNCSTDLDQDDWFVRK